MKILKSLFILFCFFLFSCGDDANDAVECSTSYTQEFQAELTDITNAITAYGEDQSAANCQALKDAYLAYIDELEGWEECATINNTVAEFDTALDGARQSVNGLVC